MTKSHQQNDDLAREASRAQLHEALLRFSDAFKDIPDDELDRELAKACAEVRAEMLAEREARQQ